MEDDGLVLTESGAIVNYDLGRYSNGRFPLSAGSQQAAPVDQSIFWSEVSSRFKSECSGTTARRRRDAS